MTILSTVCTKLLSTNAHLGRRVAAHHLKVYIRGSRNGIAILDSDKTLICLRNALHFIGSLIRKKGRSFFLKTNHFFIYSIMEKMIYSIMEKMGSCIKDSQWKIGAFLTNSYANPKKFRSRKKKIHFGLNQQPDCVVIPNPDRKSSVILEANRSQIPIASLVDSTSPRESYKRITYPIPANDTIQFIYLFRHSITKTVIRERPRITAMGTRTGTTHLSAGPGSGGGRYSTGRQLGQQRRTYSHSSQRKKRSATESLRRWVHTDPSELWMAVAPYLPQMAEQIGDAIDQAVNQATDQIDTTKQIDATSEQTDTTTTNNRIRKEDWNKKLLDAQRKRFQILAEKEFNAFLNNIDPMDLPLELKRKEYDLFLGNKDFYLRCLRVLGEKLPMLHEKHAHLADVPKDEYKLRNLLKYLLERQNKQYTLKNLFLLEKDMRNTDWLRSNISPVSRGHLIGLTRILLCWSEEAASVQKTSYVGSSRSRNAAVARPKPVNISDLGIPVMKSIVTLLRTQPFLALALRQNVLFFPICRVRAPSITDIASAEDLPSANKRTNRALIRRCYQPVYSCLQLTFSIDGIGDSILDRQEPPSGGQSSSELKLTFDTKGASSSFASPIPKPKLALDGKEGHLAFAF
ncbi:ribosomal protein S2 [Gossypium australe]|uniref:Ribosomal protein S2 n=1 Tax=Gossypium australe TaxID=47621 RepID=A0A5B6TX38_9ROSI|nr:ribosomal protein S2 [Gossypium australe]